MVPAISSAAPPPMSAPGYGAPGAATPVFGQSASLSSLGNNSMMTGLVAGALGGALGAILGEVLKNPDKMVSTTESARRMDSALFVMLVGAGIGFVLAAWPAITAKAWPKAGRDGGLGAVAGAVGGFIGGYAAQMLFTSMLESLDYTASSSEVENKIRLARMLAWAIFGAATGLGLGLPQGSKKAMNGFLGGAVGGAVGGLIFQQISDDSGFSTRLIGLVATGIGIGLGIGIVDRIRRDAWLKLTTGPLRGREIILFKEMTTIGGDNRCDVVLANDPSVAGQHASFRRTGGAATVSAMPGAVVTVNGVSISGPQPVRNGDVVQVGATNITFEERAAT